MAFIQNGVRKPKFITQLTVVKSREFLMGDLRSYITKGKTTNEKLKNLVDISAIDTLHYNFSLRNAKENTGVFFTVSNKGKNEYLINVYFIANKNVDMNKTKLVSYSSDSDTIVLHQNAWFEDEEVYNGEFQVFFNKKTKSLVVAVHPDDVKELSEDKNMTKVENDGVSVSNGVLSFNAGKKVTVLSAKNRIVSEIEKKNEKRIVAEPLKEASARPSIRKEMGQKHLLVTVVRKNQKEKEWFLTSNNFDIKKIEEMEDGKFSVYLPEFNKEFWLISETTKSLLSESRKFLLIEKGLLQDAIENIKETTLFDK